MANMSYCRFHNTLGDLQDCEQNMTEFLRPGAYDSEHAKRQRLIELCISIANEYGETDEDGVLTGNVKPVDEWEEPED